MSHTDTPSTHPKCLSETQWPALLAIADGFVGVSLPVQDSPVFSTASPSSTPAFISLLIDVLDKRIPPRARKEFALFLSLVSGVAGYAFNVHRGKLWDMDREEVEEVIQGWMRSRLGMVRMGAKGVGHLVRYLWLRTAPGIREAIGHPGIPPGTDLGTPAPSGGDTSNATQRPSPLSSATRHTVKGQSIPCLKTSVLVVGSGSGATAFTSSFVRTITSSPTWRSSFPSSSSPPPSAYSSDILILERGQAYSPRANGKPLPTHEAGAFDALFESGGALISEQSAISVATASTLGGGSRVNWSACLQTDRKVREEWTRHMIKGSEDEDGEWTQGEGTRGYGNMFLGAEWQDCLDTVEKHLGVQIPEKHQHSPANQILLEGSRRLGYAARVVPQNIRGSLDEHAQCGAHCTFGCRADDSNSGSDSNGKTPVDGKGKDEDEHDTEKPEAGRGKISGCRAFLAPLIEQGLKGDGPSVGVITGFEVDEVLWDEEDEERAVGVVGWLRCDETGGTSTGTSTETTREKVCVLAEMVVLGAGTMHTPAILMRSGVKNPHLGQHLHLHPTQVVYSTWPTQISPWHGTILTSVITEFDNLDGAAHGVKIETNCNTPVFGLIWTPWESADQWRRMIRKFPYMMSHVVICRERDTGSVRVDEDGKMIIGYTPSGFDRGHLMVGVVGLARLLYTMGAEEIYTNTAGGPVWRRSEVGAEVGMGRGKGAETGSERGEKCERGDSYKDDAAVVEPTDAIPPPSQSPAPAARKYLSYAEDASFSAFLSQLERTGNDLTTTSFGSAHQMGTCRISSSAAYGVVDPRGRVWGRRGLRVADASLMPSASGVNPMISTMGLGEWVGRRTGEEWVRRGGRV